MLNFPGFREVVAPTRLFICWFSQLEWRPLASLVRGRDRLLQTVDQQQLNPAPVLFEFVSLFCVRVC
jgi:hypothetical protein